MTRLLRATFLAVSLLALSATPAAAAILEANPAAADGASGSLRERIQAAGAGDTVRLPPGTYRLTQGSLRIEKTLILEGQGTQAAQVVVTSEGRDRVFRANLGAGTALTLRRLQVSGGRASGGIGAGIIKTDPGSLTLEEVTVSDNHASSEGGGGGLAITGGDVSILRSTVANNSATASLPSAGGGGILHSGSGALSLVNSTVAGNRVTVSGTPAGAGGSAILNMGGALTLDSVTIGYNTASPASVGALRSLTVPTLRNTIVAKNARDCVGTFNSLGFNIDGDDTCNLDEPTDQAGVDARIQPLADNGGPTPTLRLPPGSLAINNGDCGTLTTDQRNQVRPPGGGDVDCDVGAVEFEGWAKVDVPPCTRTGALPFRVDSPPGSGLEALNYTLDGGDVSDPLQVPVSGTSATGTLQIHGEGRRRLEYWSDSFPTGIDQGTQLKHSTPLVVIDRTDPRVNISNPNAFRVFVIRRDATVNVNASDSISGLVLDPSGRRPLDTSARGTKTFRAGAVDLCTNTAAAPFSYRVLAPGLGVRAVVERVRGTVLSAPGVGSARASQKGQGLTAVREPREVPVSSLIDARRGTVRVTSSRDARTGIQDAQFSGGRFQVLQSRRRSARGLTELRLKGSSFRSCGRARRSGTSAAARKRVIRRLRGRGRGRFRTRGRYSSATVRGTTWTVEDRCDGTLTRVRAGRVLVRDFGRRRTIVVRAGKSHLARARR